MFQQQHCGLEVVVVDYVYFSSKIFEKAIWLILIFVMISEQMKSAQLSEQNDALLQRLVDTEAENAVSLIDDYLTCSS